MAHNLGTNPATRRPLLMSDLRNHAPGLKRPQFQRIRAVEALLDRGFPYSRKLNAHISCVNALAFSSLDGRFLASGGDDLSIHLWDLHEEQVCTPCCSFRGPRRNIFVLSFSANNRFLFSGGADEIVLKFDASQLERPLTSQPARSPRNIFPEHEGSIRGIAPHPVQDEIFITGSEDGRLILRDGRTVPGVRARAQDTIQLTSEVTGVQFHPRMEHVFATSDGNGRVCLRDMRMGFGPLAHRTQNGVVQIYNTKISRRSALHLSNPETSSISFNQQGTQLGVTMLNYFPTIYALIDPDPVAVCSAANLPDGTPIPPGQRTYANACTMKHGSFGGPGLDTDALYVAGSDDFRAYVWALPPPARLAAQRTILSHAEWEAGAHVGVVAFAESPTAPRCVPAQLHTPRARLGGHASIVNTVLVHPRMLLAATAGVEAGIVLHGAVDSLLGGMAATSTQMRELGEEWVPDLGEEGAERWVDEQTETIELFDDLLQRERQADVFVLRRWRGDGDATADSSDSDSDSDSDSGSEGEDEEGESDSDAVEQNVEMEEADEQDAG
ncbi:WD40 repeat-like protein [Mycena alexandri]|uniref:WD40 repeat-like protein n=1 Tax=Mycena alexandri TaxID=1745969 RepID=A0AAD6WRN2_9AGAR|nr:WD40 repeat-like protein [Mycena alexandri]